MSRLRKCLALCLIGCLVTPIPVSAATTSDKALALATSGCLLGWISVNPEIDFLSEQVVASAVLARSDNNPNSLVNIHNEHISESWNSASSLDLKWRVLLKSYNDINFQLDNKFKANETNGNIIKILYKKFGAIIRSNCKIAITLSTSKAKKAKISLAKWIYSNAGSLLPRLDPDSVIK